MLLLILLALVPLLLAYFSARWGVDSRDTIDSGEYRRRLDFAFWAAR